MYILVLNKLLLCENLFEMLFIWLHYSLYLRVAKKNHANQTLVRNGPLRAIKAIDLNPIYNLLNFFMIRQ